MDFSLVTVDICQPNGTIAHLLQTLLEEVGAQTRRDATLREPASLLIFDMDARQDAMSLALLERYEHAGAPVLMCGLRHLRETFDAMPSEHWLERPFSPRVVLGQVAQILGVPAEALAAPPRPQRPKSSPRPGNGEGPPTRELEVDEASFLEEEFGLEPGILGGGLEVPLDELGEAERAQEGLEEFSAQDSLEFTMGGGRLMGEVVSQRFAADALAVDEPTANMSAAGPPPPLEPRTRQQTVPDMPASTRASVPERKLDLGPEFSPAAPPSHGELMPETSNFGLPALDDETSLELRSFARMLAEAWGKIGQSARAEDRFDRLNRVLHALFERGLDGAGDELRRIPQTEGFTGSLRALSIVGLLRTIRERKLRGRLEVSTQEQAYVIYLDGPVLSDIDVLAGDSEQMLLRILREQGALSDAVYQELLSGHEDPSQLLAPVEMRLRTEGLVLERELGQARALRAREIFGKACKARSGHFAFIEIFRGDAHAWPTHDLRLNVEELLLELLRREGSVETGVSEATSRTRLAPDPSSLAQMRRDALTVHELELLRFFERGGTVGAARLKMQHIGQDVDVIIQRLKKAELLQRIPVESPIRVAQEETRVSGEYEAILMPALELESSEATAITQIPERLLGEDLEQADSLEVFEGDIEILSEHDLYPMIEEESAHERPTRSVKGHMVAPPEDLFGPPGELERLLDEISAPGNQEGDE